MVFDLDMVTEFYSNYATKVATAREFIVRPLTLSEKILYAHLWEELPKKAF